MGHGSSTSTAVTAATSRRKMPPLSPISTPISAATDTVSTANNGATNIVMSPWLDRLNIVHIEFMVDPQYAMGRTRQPAPTGRANRPKNNAGRRERFGRLGSSSGSDMTTGYDIAAAPTVRICAVHLLRGCLDRGGSASGTTPLLTFLFGLATALGAVPAPEAEALDHRVGELYAKGQYAEAEEAARESLSIRRELLEPGHADIARSLNNLAIVLKAQGDYAGARPLYEEGLAIQRIALGPRHADVALSLNNLAILMQDLGDAGASIPLMEESLSIRRESLGPRSAEAGATMNSLALALHDIGDVAAARALFEEAIVILREALGPGHPHVASSLNNYAILLKDLGDYRAAQSLHEEALAIRIDLFGTQHPDVATSLNNLGSILLQQGDFAGARPLLERSLEIWRDGLGPRHPHVATSLHNLAVALDAEGDDERALASFEESLELTRDAFGEQHLEVAKVLGNLGTFLWRHGDTVAGRDLLQREVAIRRRSGEDRIGLAIALTNQAAVLESMGDIDGARPLQDEALAIMVVRGRHLDALSLREALHFLHMERPILDGWLTLFDRPDDHAAAWSHVLRVKGTVAARARSAHAVATIEPELAGTAAELYEARRQLARLVFAEPDLAEMDTLSATQERLERRLLADSARYRLATAAERATPAKICEAMPEGTALIDILRYVTSEAPRYLAFVLRQGDCRVLRVDLGSSTLLEEVVRDWRVVLRNPDEDPRRVTQRGQVLSAILLDPLLEVAGDSLHWLVVPDGPLATVPLGALPTATGFAIEDRQITYLDRANDVLLIAGEVGSGALLVGGVDYDAVSSSTGEARSFLAPCNGGEFVPLPGAASETEQFRDSWRRHRRKEPLVVLSGAEATESVVTTALSGKAVAHIATHGFFATGDCKSALEHGAGYDPMLLSGLVLAGANRPVDALAVEDGILTAAEVATHDMSGTRLVVLSACETGLGEVVTGQGVLGLRRAFTIAGAQTLIMSLWAVPDEDTAALMDGLYMRHLRRKGMSAPDALRAAQLALLARQRRDGDEHPVRWAGFIASGEWR